LKKKQYLRDIFLVIEDIERMDVFNIPVVA
jgi:hypothetical protein